MYGFVFEIGGVENRENFSLASGSSGRRRILSGGMVPLIPDLRSTSQSFSPSDNSRAMNRSPGCMVEVAFPPHSVDPYIVYSPGPSSVAITASCDQAVDEYISTRLARARFSFLFISINA